MNCQEAEERLPWLVGGGLPADEARAVRDHLEGCAACRQALEETREAGEVLGAHLPAPVLLDLAWDRPGTQIPDGLAQRHLQSCADCAEELALSRQSRALESATELATAPAPRRARARLSGWAAPLAAGLAIGLGLGMLRNTGPTGGPAVPPSSDPEARRLREDNAALREQLADARSPQVNLPVVELFAADTVVRGGAAPEAPVEIPAGAREVVLLLAAGAPGDRPGTVELRDAGGKALWSGAGLRPGGQGAYTLAVPSSLLPEGSYTMVIQPQGSPAIRYQLRVRRSK